MNRPVWVLSLLVTGLIPLAAAQEPPLAVLSIKSASRAQECVDTVGRWIAAEGDADTQIPLIQRMLKQYLAILRPGTPIGAAVWLTPEGAPDVLIFLPAADLTPLLVALAPFLDGLHDVGDAKMLAVPGAGPVYFKSQEDWTYVATGEARLAALPADPGQLLGSLARVYDLGVRVDVQAMPEPLREQLLQMVGSTAAMPGPGVADSPLEEFPAGDLPSDEAAESSDPIELVPAADPQQIEQQVASFREFLEETDQLVFGITVDDSDQQLQIDFAHRAVPGSSMAQDFSAWQQKRATRFAGFYRPEAGLHTHANMVLTEASVERLEQQLDTAMKFVLSENELSADSPEALGVQAAFGLAKEFFGHGDVDVVASLSLEGKPNLLVAGKVGDGANVAAMIQRAAAKVAKRPEVSTREQTVGDLPLLIWKFKIPQGPDTKEVIRFFGEEVELATGVTGDQAYLSVGPPGAEQSLAKSVAASGGVATRLSLPSLFWLDGKKIAAHLPPAEMGEEDFWQQLARADAPAHLRWSMRPFKSGGVIRTELGAGIFSALVTAARSSSFSFEESAGDSAQGEGSGLGEALGSEGGFEPEGDFDAEQDGSGDALGSEEVAAE